VNRENGDRVARRPRAKTWGVPDFRGDIQGLRAIAVLAVIASHIALYQGGHPRLGVGGFIGVDVFFVLSGYLITSLLLRESMRTGRVSIPHFYARRARRILPAATVVLFVVVAVSALNLTEVERSQYSQDAAWSVAFLANWHFASAGVNYFDTSLLSPLQHFWSLAVEEQFYLVWPVLIGLLAPRLRRASLGAVVTAICAASLAWSIFATSLDGPLATHEAYFSSFARAYELGIGSMAAIFLARTRSTRWRAVVGASSLLVILACIVLMPADAPFPGWQALIPCLAAALLIVVGQGNDPTLVQKLLSVHPLRFIGNISYSAYLWHFPIIVLAPRLFPDRWNLAVLISIELVVTLSLSTISYYVIEQPFHRDRVPLIRSRSRALILWPLALVIVFGAISAGGAYAAHERALQAQAAADWARQHTKQPKISTLPAPLNASAAVSLELEQALALADEGAPFPASVNLRQIEGMQPGRGYMCFSGDGGLRPPRPCIYGDQAATWVVALVGDSHAGMLIPFLDAMGKRDHFKVVMYQKLGCAPYYVEQRAGPLGDECDNFRAWTLRKLQLDRPNVVVLYGRGFLYDNPRAGQTVAGVWRSGEISAVRAFKRLGARIVLVGDVPDRGGNPAICIEGNVHQSSCVVTPSSPESQSNLVTEAVARLEHAAFLPLQPFVCRGGRCPLVVGDRILYWDDSHLSRAWIDHISPALRQKFAPLIEPR
jgi:peptidoglycan/LPS O-acetylase OafA/YrhL